MYEQMAGPDSSWLIKLRYAATIACRAHRCVMGRAEETATVWWCKSNKTLYQWLKTFPTQNHNQTQLQGFHTHLFSCYHHAHSSPTHTPQPAPPHLSLVLSLYSSTPILSLLFWDTIIHSCIYRLMHTKR